LNSFEAALESWVYGIGWAHYQVKNQVTSLARMPVA
jgi:hypothetical protein